MSSYLMFLPQTNEEKIFLNKIFFGARKANDMSQRECLVIDQSNKMYGVSLSFFHHMRHDEEYRTRDITYREVKLLALRHATGEITLN